VFCLDRFNPSKDFINYSQLHLRELLKIPSNNISQSLSTVESLPDFRLSPRCSEVRALLGYDES
jgi:hypothetical protein